MHSAAVFSIAIGSAAFALAAPVETPIVCVENSTGQVPFKFPLANGFPNVSTNSSALSQIEKQAHGTLPNTALPTEIKDTSATVWELIAFNEIFEVAFFSSLLSNITGKVAGYDLSLSPDGAQIAKDIKAICAQEELHALGANLILSTAGREAVQPCEYKFPSDNFEAAIDFASEFTDLVIGTLEEALYDFGLDGDIEFLELVGAVIGQEGEQNGAFRILEGRVNGQQKIPSALPFLTASSGPFALSSLMQNVVVPGSCPNAAEIGLTILGALSVETPSVTPWTSAINFTFASNSTGLSTTDDLYLVYVNQQNAPVVESLSNLTTVGGTTSFSAVFPYEEYELNGLTIAAVTKGSGPFANASAVASSAVLGPALIEIN